MARKKKQDPDSTPPITSVSSAPSVPSTSQSTSLSPINKGAAALLASALTDDSAAEALLSSLGVSSLNPNLPAQQALVTALSNAIGKVDIKQVSANVTHTLIDRYQFVRLEQSTKDTKKQAYTLYSKTPDQLTYVNHSLLQLKYEILNIARVWLQDEEQERILNAFLNTVPIIKERERRFMAIGPQLYWDSNTQSLVPQVPQGHRCFIRLFDSPDRVGGGIVSYPKESFDSTFSELVEKEYNYMLSNLHALKDPNFNAIIGKCPRDFHFIEEWANDDPGLYWDILTMIATVFMRNKPLGAYFLIGLSRNGKSSCVNLLHSIFGTNNTSRVRLSQIGDAHFANTLTTSILNAPDDENDDITKHQGTFKELAGHQLYSATQLYSGTPLTINGADITFVFPMNTLPKWKGTSAAACSKRTNPIPFMHDFSVSDNKTNNFEQVTYTRDTLGRIAGQAMALATYFDEHPEAFGYSEASISQKEMIAEDNNNVTEYKKQFEMFFCGFQKKELLYADYQLWCNYHEFRYTDKKTLELAFQSYFDNRYRMNKTYTTATGKVSRKCRKSARSKPYAPPLMNDFYIPEIKRTVEDLHESGLSAVSTLWEIYEDNFDV